MRLALAHIPGTLAQRMDHGSRGTLSLAWSGTIVAELIARMDRWLAANRPDYYAKLQPGVTDLALTEFENRFQLKLPDSFRALYAWRNGLVADRFRPGGRIFRLRLATILEGLQR
ncbi:MAG: hypothetical protein JO122_04920 [Acetobacteraceae bacterium]|nr:hypothetical protein [Acetobacteraceae bacterium]